MYLGIFMWKSSHPLWYYIEAIEKSSQYCGGVDFGEDTVKISQFTNYIMLELRNI